MVASKSMAMVAGGVNFCSIARDFGLLPFCRDFRNVWRDSCSDFFFFFFFLLRETSGNGIFNFSEFCFRLRRDLRCEGGFVVIRIRIC